MATDTITIPRSEYEKLKRQASKSPFLKELEEAMASCVSEPLREVHLKPKR